MIPLECKNSAEFEEKLYSKLYLTSLCLFVGFVKKNGKLSFQIKISRKIKYLKGEFSLLFEKLNLKLLQ